MKKLILLILLACIPLMGFAGAKVKTVDQVAEEKADKKAKDDAIKNSPKVSPLKHKSALVTVKGQKAMKVHIRTKDMKPEEPDLEGFLWFTPMEGTKYSYLFHFAKSMDEVGDGGIVNKDIAPPSVGKMSQFRDTSRNQFTANMYNSMDWRKMGWRHEKSAETLTVSKDGNTIWTWTWFAPDPKGGYEQSRVEWKVIATGNKMIIPEEDWEDLLTLWGPDR